MKTPRSVWISRVRRAGSHEARTQLRPQDRKPRVEPKEATGLELVWKLIHKWPGGTPMDNRRRFTMTIRKALERIKTQRIEAARKRAQGVLFH